MFWLMAQRHPEAEWGPFRYARSPLGQRQLVPVCAISQFTVAPGVANKVPSGV